MHVGGAGQGGDLVWDANGAIGAVYALWAMVESLRHACLGVGAIALLALVGALGVGEHLAAAVVSIMLASGRSLESWAAGRARHDLRALLELSPKSAHRYAEDGLASRCRSSWEPATPCEAA
jgi:cation transport ATPase